MMARKCLQKDIDKHYCLEYTLITNTLREAI